MKPTFIYPSNYLMGYNNPYRSLIRGKPCRTHSLLEPIYTLPYNQSMDNSTFINEDVSFLI